MGRLLEFTHSLWIKVQLKTPPPMQRTVIPRLHEMKEFVRLVIRPYLPVYQLQGQAQGGPLTVTYIGLEFAKPSLKSILFVEEPVEQQVGRLPFWRYGELANWSSSDIIIIHAARHLIHKLPDQNAIVFPQLIEHILDVRGDWQDVQSRFRKTIHKNELRLIRKHGYEYDVSYDRLDFEEFYHQMCLPTTRERHGKQSRPFSIEEAYQYFQHGWLFRVKRDGIWVSGSICHLQHNILVIDMVGVRNADEQLIWQGATAATFYTAIHWANQNGCKAVNFLGSGSYLQGGLFQHKRKWGTTIRISPYLHRLTWLKIQRRTPAVVQFLKENPVVTVDKDGKLHGLIVVDDSQDVSDEIRKEWEKHYVIPGLSSFLIRSVSSFTGEPAHGSEPDLVIPMPPSSSSGNGQ